MANVEVEMITPEQGDAIIWACDQLISGQYHEQFPIDMIQGGAGTSTNMAANEVIANLALERMGHKRGEYQYCSPNDVVNASQSTNDAYPCAIHMAMCLEHLEFMPRVEKMIESLDKKSKEFAHVIKMGRTQLQDAVPMTLGQTFGGFAASLRGELANLRNAADEFLIVNMGATAIGTGICSRPGYSEACIRALRKVTGWNISLADNLIEATSATSCMIQYSSSMKRLAIKINKMCNDLRLLSSGPRCGLNEIHLPERQPGSSIMPGKVNPVIPEVMNQVCYKVIGNDMTISLASDNGQLELNVMEPVIAYTLFESIHLLENGYDTLIEGDGTNLSQGQRQLLNIARAAISKAPILVLDEATSSVDTRTERHIERGMDRIMKTRTTFVIAHRLSTVRNANAIMVLEHGEIIERGDHDDLLAQKGRYYELYTGKAELA